MNETAVAPTFVRKEREHLDVLQQRLDHLRDDRPERGSDPNYIAGEAGAIAWALSVLKGQTEPVDLRIERVERAVRVLQTRLGRVEHELEEEDEL